jgi:hypothetical protein
MADDRRRRFLQIERPRGPGGPAAGPTPSTDARFGAAPTSAPARGPDAPPAPEVAAGHVDRFRPAADRPLDVAARGEASQPFVRCCRCETDNSTYAVRCTTCQAELHTDEQRAFNERLWAARLAEASAEAEGVAARRAALDAATEEAARGRREGAAVLAREVGDRERRRLEQEGVGEPSWGPRTGWGGTGDAGIEPGVPAGLRLLRLIRDPRWRAAAGAAVVAVPALLLLWVPRAGLLAAAATLALFLPGRWRWRRRRWW